MEGHGRSRKIKEDHVWSFPITGLTFNVRKVRGGGAVLGWPVRFYCQPQSQTLSSVLWILDFGLGFWTRILDLDLGLDLGLTILLIALDSCCLIEWFMTI